MFWQETFIWNNESCTPRFKKDSTILKYTLINSPSQILLPHSLETQTFLHSCDMAWRYQYSKKSLLFQLMENLACSRPILAWFTWFRGLLHVRPPFASGTSHKKHLSRTANFVNQIPQVGPSRKRPPLVSGRKHFWRLRFNYPLFLTSVKRPFDSLYDLFVRLMLLATQSVWRTLVTKCSYTFIVTCKSYCMY